ncbi:hypothetical protein B7P43_G17485 [Cryptotermes secundus]|uniref:Uncharacterized protein n=1 Tax=Cryptotermes secundus TaxID=105785 RepID=A0A2J7Q1A0_9NEOP|nr:hypothetical protein B7P43_G17485 [Cryptotermes secundus]
MRKRWTVLLLIILESLLDYLESEENSLLSDKLILRRLHTDICKKENAAKKQMTVLNFKC